MKNAHAGIIEYLGSRAIAVVSTVSKEGLPQAATVFYWVDETVHGGFSLYFVTRRHTRKFSNIMHNPAVAVVVGTDMDPHTVQIEGEAELVEVGESVTQLGRLAMLVGKHPKVAALYTGAFYPKDPFSGIEGKDFAVFRVSPKWVRYMTYDEEKRDIVYLQTLP